MHLRMAVQARLSEHGALDTWYGTEIIEFVTMRIPGVGLLVALLAELRRASYQCPRLNRTMWIVTDGALLEDRFVFPQEGAPFFRMTGVTILIHRELPQFFVTGRLMRLMAVTTIHLPMTQWMAMLTQDLGANVCVACRAGLRHFHFAGPGLPGVLYGVTIGTADPCRLVVACSPVTFYRTTMTIQADAVGLIEGIERLFPECTNILAAFRVHVYRTGAMTGFAGVFILHIVREYRAMLHRGMASQTCITPDHVSSKQRCCHNRDGNNCKNRYEARPHAFPHHVRFPHHVP